MEEISKPQIARLILGYLKKENYKAAYNYFYKQCPYFEKFRQRKHKISMRFNGMTLEDILQQYTEIYSIVQPRLEDTEYYENQSFHYQELPQQLLYLLNHRRHKSASTTPNSRSPSPGEGNESGVPSYLSSMEVSANLDCSTTPLNTLPGNSVEGGKFKKPMIYNSSQTEHEESSSGEAEKGFSEVVEAFKESLLAHEELQEKIAHTINEVRYSDGKELLNPSSGCEVETAIKAIINRTATDPAFETLMDEILGPSQSAEQEIPSSTTSGNASDKRGTIANKEDVIVFDSTVVVNQPVLLNASPPCSPSINVPLTVSATSELGQFTLTEQDILAMPVYVCDENQQGKVILEQGLRTEKRLKTLMPVCRPVRTADNLVEFITMYSCDNNEEPCEETSNSTQPYAVTILPAGEPLPVEIRANNKTPELVMPASKASAQVSRSGNRSSHVRALDFQKFQTPGKEMATNEQATHKKSSKSLFPAGSTLKEPWDQKFRACLAKPKLVASCCDEEADKKPPNENVDTSNNSKTAKPSARKRKGKTKATPSTCANQAAKVNETTPLPSKMPYKRKFAHVNMKEDFLNGGGCKLININKPPMFKRKCNIDNKRECKDSKVVATTTTTTTTTAADTVKVVETASSSKLNGSKRSLVEQEAQVTPEGVRIQPAVVPTPSNARSIMPLLQTPGKDMYPKTPNVYNPSTAEDTPFTKMFKEHTSGVDIASIPTPKSMLTPSFPFTPFMEAHETPQTNRPTDYSTSSSYYQPSDTEQNKSIEKLIKECQRLEETSQSTSTPNLAVAENVKTVGNNVVAMKNLNLVKADRNKVKTEQTDTVVEPAEREINTVIVEHMRSLRSNVIAKKNLNLVKPKVESSMSTNCSSSRSSSSSSTSSSSSSEDDDDEDDDLADTPIDNTVENRYSLRSRPSSNSTSNKTEPAARKKTSTGTGKTKDTVETKNNVEQKAISSTTEDHQEKATAKEEDKKEDSNTACVPTLNRQGVAVGGSKTKLFTDLEAKRKRTVDAFKDETDEKPKPTKTIKPPPKKRKTVAKKRVLRSSSAKQEDDLQMTSSDEEDKVRPFELVETELLCPNSNTPTQGVTEIARPTLPVGEQKSHLCTANSAQHDEIIVGNTLDVALVVDVRTRKLPPKKRETAVNKRKTEKKSQPAVIPSQPKAKQPPKKSSSRSSKKSPRIEVEQTAAKVENEPAKSEKAIDEKVQTIPEENIVIKPTVNKLTTEGIQESDDAKIKKGTTAPEDKSKLMKGMKEMGFPVVENRKADRLSNEVSAHPQDEIESTRKSYTPPLPIEDTIGRCITVINSSEEDLIYFDTKVFSEALWIDGSVLQGNLTTRDYADDNVRVTKSYKMTVYDDSLDAEVQKVLHVTPYVDLFTYDADDEANMPQRRNKVTVLNNVVIKKEKPLKRVFDTLISDEVSSIVELDEARNPHMINRSSGSERSNSEPNNEELVLRLSVDEDVSEDVGEKSKSLATDGPVKTFDDSKPTSEQITSDNKKRKANSPLADANKKANLDDHQALLQNLNVEDLLEKIYG